VNCYATTSLLLLVIMEKDLSNLSREDLVKMLQKKSGGNTPESLVGKQCLWTYVNNNKRCAKTSINHWGFCETHRGSVQSLKAKAAYDEVVKSLETENTQSVEEKIEKLEEEVLAEEVPAPKAKGRGRKTVAAKPTKAAVVKAEESEEEEDEVQEPEPESPPKTKAVKSAKPKAPAKVVKAAKPVAPKTPAKTKAPVKAAKTESSAKSVKTPAAPAKGKTPVKGVQKPVTRTKIIKPNYWGRYEDPETGIVFNPKDKTAYGVQDPTGAVHGLTKEHIKICIKNGWNYNDLNPLGEETDEEENSEETSEVEESGEETSEESEDEESEEEDWEESEEESSEEEESEGESEEESSEEEDSEEEESSEEEGSEEGSEDYEDVTDEEE
jgi:hypothetical protein